jgi:multimeric flavodoxin WrbA
MYKGDIFMKHITAVIGSPHFRSSNTVQLTTDFLEVVRQADSSISYEVISLGSQNIGVCKGCWACTRTGACVIQDDLPAIHAKLLASDMVILGSPVYVEHVSAQLKAFIDRSFIWFHTLRLIGKPSMSVLTTGGSGISTTEKYLDEILYLLGTIPVGHLRGIGYEPGNFPGRERCRDTYRKLAHKAAAILNGQKPLRPTFWNYWYFWGMKMKSQRGAQWLPFEHEYWQKSGWAKLSYDQAAQLAKEGTAAS